MSLINFFRFVPKKRKVRINNKKGIIFFNPPLNKRLPFYFANVIFLAVLSYGLYLYLPLIRALSAYNQHQEIEKSVVVNTGSIAITPTPVDKGYWIYIPKILANSKVVEDVSPYDPVEYNRVLKENVVAQSDTSRAPGSGKGKSTYIFAHSSESGISGVRNNAVFYLLGKLEIGDVIEIDYHGAIKNYSVYDKKIIKANDIGYLEYSDPEKEVLILQTCWPIGTDWNRLLIFGELI
ncbi:sortase [Candidatus Shapirobacteria bacterium]|jgi:LPXTG-site transpeptidase (sortase) family protein|nr:sortase [Candidatus Shapirobacteria bacterium]HQI13065.1 sortase [Candidatus Woesebacteria bacterium]